MTKEAAAPEPDPEIVKAIRERLAPSRKRVNVRLLNPQGHPGQMQLCRIQCKRKIVCAGRRAGKTTGSSILAVEAFLGTPGVEPKRVLYAAPTIDQVEKFWVEVKKALKEPLTYKVFYKNETKHIIQRSPIQDNLEAEKRGDPRIRAKTAYNAQSLRGDYADLLILDEFQLMDETAWTEVGAPMLIDNNGDVVFIYTPPSLQSRSASKARDPLHVAKMFKQYKDNPDWLCIHFSSHDNPHISEEGIREVAKNMTSLAYRQEILAQDIDEVPGALWKREWLEKYRIAAYNPLA